jgi:aspartyl/glutamyl-tRNA(Asn/Gln) amidotransferase C subunit
MAEITKKSLAHLADLARLELSEKEGEKFLGDLEKILNHFEELQEVNTENVQPMAGGMESKNVLREDGETKSSLKPDGVVEAFPEKEKHYLKTPPVFE